MRGLAPILLFALAGILLGGTWSLYKQGAHKGVVLAVGLLTLLAAGGAVFWLMPGEA
ncbi:hypothetical protein [Hamadaea tsunoensis]|uniref:hypothetical protein n=1 Tax=Hamadaea tsunoensis TaxID=53368 RepID=UPI000403A815|nr:hypothetical protein [Hamadaea tsunoensis]